jgi:transcription initiation factor TFIIF subunit beta
MDDPAVDDEKKPFDALGSQNDEDSQPDPDEHIMLESGHGRVWQVKVYTHFPPITSFVQTASLIPLSRSPNF